MTGTAARPDLATATALLETHDVVPIVVELDAGAATPVTLMQRLGVNGHCFLLESATGAAGMHGYSFLGHRPERVAEDGGGDPLAPLADTVAERVAGVDGYDAPFAGGWVGFLGYEVAACYERLPVRAPVVAGVPRSTFALYRTVAVFDHARGRVQLVTQLRRDDGAAAIAYTAALDRLDLLAADITGQHPEQGAVDDAHAVAAPSLDGTTVTAQMPRLGDGESTFAREDFKRAVSRALAHIVAGDVFQVQVSRHFSMELTAHPFTLYTALRDRSPTPYLFYVSSPSCVLVGASPEMLVRVRGDRVEYRPIAGTRRRGVTEAQDLAMEAELHSSEKEQAEHLMLVDLGRNDVGRVAVPGSVEVRELGVVERYSNVMHLVSGIRARLAPEHTALDALRACFPAGTVTGAPKIRAMEIIADLEPHGRGPYAGAVGYIGSGGVLDTAIALRTVLVAGGRAHLQAAAGIVADSTPDEEAREIDNKLLAALQAVLRVNAL
jgi:anthranilate synthase component 1